MQMSSIMKEMMLISDISIHSTKIYVDAIRLHMLIEWKNEWSAVGSANAIY